MKGEVFAEFTREFSDTVDGDFGGVIKVINDDGLKAAEQKLKHGVAADITGPAGDQYGLGHERFRAVNTTAK